MYNYKSKPHTVKAFQFNVPFVEHEVDWYWEQVKKGKASTTYNRDGSYISVYSKKGQIERAYIGDWVCLSKQDKLYVIDDKTFKECYEIGG